MSAGGLMGKLIFSILIIFSSISSAQTPPSLEVIDGYVAIAHALDEESLRGEDSKWKCNFSIMHNNLNASAMTIEQATQRLQLLCIKKECQNIGSKVSESSKKIMQMEAQELRRLLEFAQYPLEEIDLILKQRDTFHTPREELNCKTGPSSYKMLAVDSCFSIPVTCIKQ